MGDARDLNWVIFVISMLIVMQDFIANRNLHGRLPQNVTRLTPILSNALIHFNVVHQPTAGTCLRLIDELTLRNAFHYIHKKKEQQWAGNQTTL